MVGFSALFTDQFLCFSISVNISKDPEVSKWTKEVPILLKCFWSLLKGPNDISFITSRTFSYTRHTKHYTVNVFSRHQTQIQYTKIHNPNTPTTIQQILQMKHYTSNIKYKTLKPNHYNQNTVHQPLYTTTANTPF